MILIPYVISDNKKCGVIGYGSWATALVHVLTNNGIEVWWHIRNDEIREILKSEGRNAKYLSDLSLDMTLINISDDIDEVIRQCEVLLVAIPSAFIKDVFNNATENLANKFILSATKGFVGKECTVTEYFKNRYSIDYAHLGVISGPSHAEEVSRDKLSYLTVVCKVKENTRLIGEMFQNKNLKVKSSQDIFGIEYAAILKNIYAIASGLATGLGYGDNFKAVLSAACITELTWYLDNRYPFLRNTMGSAYLGDLLVTSYSSFSRNRRLGQLIGQGYSVKSALNEMTMITEGYYAANSLHEINKKLKISLPITEMVYDILYNRANPRKKMQELGELI